MLLFLPFFSSSCVQLAINYVLEVLFCLVLMGCYIRTRLQKCRFIWLKYSFAWYCSVKEAKPIGFYLFMHIAPRFKSINLHI